MYLAIHSIIFTKQLVLGTVLESGNIVNKDRWMDRQVIWANRGMDRREKNGGTEWWQGNGFQLHQTDELK
jgi:hypothetical protein